MTTRMGLGIVAAVLFFNPGAALSELRPAEMRPEVMEVGDPVAISRDTLAQEMKLNSELRWWIRTYGWPDYSEVQEVTVQVPLAPYEVRLYYLRRNQQLTFSRVYVSPAMSDYGIRVYEGEVSPETLDRLLTATPASPVAGNEEAEGDMDAEPIGDPVQVAVRAIDDDSDPMERIEASLRRMEAAAERASQAAEQAERSSIAATMASDRAAAALEKMAH